MHTTSAAHHVVLCFVTLKTAGRESRWSGYIIGMGVVTSVVVMGAVVTIACVRHWNLFVNSGVRLVFIVR